MQGDVSFTFLDRIEEVELNIVDRRWQSALALALTLPDICGGIAFPEIVKHYRDGRVMLDRQKNPTRDVGTSIFAGLMNMQGTTLNYLNPMKSHIFAENAVGSFDVNIFIKIKDF